MRTTEGCLEWIGGAFDRGPDFGGVKWCSKVSKNTRLAEKRLKNLIVEWSDPVAALGHRGSPRDRAFHFHVSGIPETWKSARAIRGAGR
jgi:hypothetical protein